MAPSPPFLLYWRLSSLPLPHHAPAAHFRLASGPDPAQLRTGLRTPALPRLAARHARGRTRRRAAGGRRRVRQRQPVGRLAKAAVRVPAAGARAPARAAAGRRRRQPRFGRTAGSARPSAGRARHARDRPCAARRRWRYRPGTPAAATCRAPMGRCRPGAWPCPFCAPATCRSCPPATPRMPTWAASPCCTANWRTWRWRAASPGKPSLPWATATWWAAKCRTIPNAASSSAAPRCCRRGSSMPPSRMRRWATCTRRRPSAGKNTSAIAAARFPCPSRK